MDRAELREPSGISSLARAAGAELMEGATRVLPTLGAPSPLGTVVFAVCANRIEISGTRGIAIGHALMGYACRVGDAVSPRAGRHIAELAGELLFTRGGEVDYALFLERPAQIEALADRVIRLAATPVSVAEAGLLGVDVWRAFERDSVTRLRKHFLRRGASPSELPIDRQARHLVRLGFALRLLDEAAAESPAGPVRCRSEARLGRDALRGAESWLSAAASWCGVDLGSDVELMLDAGLSRVLGEDALRLDGDAAAIAVADARLGYALRRLERRHPGQADGTDPFSQEAVALDQSGSIPGFVADVVRYGYCGGAVAAIARMPGATGALRTTAFAEWSERRRRAQPSRSDEDVLALVRYGYLIRRVLELRGSPAALLDAVPRSRGGD